MQLHRLTTPYGVPELTIAGSGERVLQTMKDDGQVNQSEQLDRPSMVSQVEFVVLATVLNLSRCIRIVATSGIAGTCMHSVVVIM